MGGGQVLANPGLPKDCTTAAHLWQEDCPRIAPLHFLGNSGLLVAIGKKIARELHHCISSGKYYSLVARCKKIARELLQCISCAILDYLVASAAHL